jgi:hypothetical protein
MVFESSRPLFEAVGNFENVIPLNNHGEILLSSKCMAVLISEIKLKLLFYNSEMFTSGTNYWKVDFRQLQKPKWPAA